MLSTPLSKQSGMPGSRGVDRRGLGMAWLEASPGSAFVRKCCLTPMTDPHDCCLTPMTVTAGSTSDE